MSESRLKLAAEYGADHCLNAADCDVPGQVRACTSGCGADIAMEVVGTSETV